MTGPLRRRIPAHPSFRPPHAAGIGPAEDVPQAGPFACDGWLPTGTMTTIRTIPVHAIVDATYPRPPPTPQSEVAKAAGRAIDGAQSRFGHEFRQGRRPTLTAMRAEIERLFDEALEEGAVEIPAPERDRMLLRFGEVLQAFRKSEIFGLPRPKSRVILIDGRVGVYAQPDYWDGVGRFFEMKSYLAIPPPPDVALQLRLFQLAFPRFEAHLVCIDRHQTPVKTTSLVLPPPTEAESRSALRTAFEIGSQAGQPKVLEYMEGPFVRYDLPIGPA